MNWRSKVLGAGTAATATAALLVPTSAFAIVPAAHAKTEPAATQSSTTQRAVDKAQAALDAARRAAKKSHEAVTRLAAAISEAERVRREAQALHDNAQSKLAPLAQASGELLGDLNRKTALTLSASAAHDRATSIRDQRKTALSSARDAESRALDVRAQAAGRVTAAEQDLVHTKARHGANSSQARKAAAALSSAKKALKAARDAATRATTQRQAAKASYDDAQAAATQTGRSLSAANAEEKKVKSSWDNAHRALSEAENALATAKSSVTQADTDLENLRDRHSDALSAAEAADARVTTAEQHLLEAQGVHVPGVTPVPDEDDPEGSGAKTPADPRPSSATTVTASPHVLADGPSGPWANDGDQYVVPEAVLPLTPPTTGRPRTASPAPGQQPEDTPLAQAGAPAGGHPTDAAALPVVAEEATDPAAERGPGPVLLALAAAVSLAAGGAVWGRRRGRRRSSRSLPDTATITGTPQENAIVSMTATRVALALRDASGRLLLCGHAGGPDLPSSMLESGKNPLAAASALISSVAGWPAPDPSQMDAQILGTADETAVVEVRLPGTGPDIGGGTWVSLDTAWAQCAHLPWMRLLLPDRAAPRSVWA